MKASREIRGQSYVPPANPRYPSEPRSHRVVRSFLMIAILLALAVEGFAQEKSRPKSQEQTSDTGDAVDCSTKLVSGSFLKPPEHWSPGQQYRGAPVLHIKIDESGAVSKVRVTRSSGIKEIDRWARAVVKRWRYNPAPGCGLREGNIEVTIDFGPENDKGPA